MALKDMRDELRELRKSSGHRPISKMRKEDVSREIERLKVGREETPAVAATPSSASKKKMVSAVESVKEAKMMEFPHKPETTIKSGKKSATAAGKAGAVAAAGGDKKKSKRDMMMKLMAMMESDEE